MKQNMLFILGNLRSGTTLLRLILDSHSNITVPPECGFLLWLKPKYFDWKTEDINTRTNLFIDDLLKSRKFETWKVEASEIEKIITIEKPHNYDELCKCVYMAYGKKNRAS